MITGQVEFYDDACAWGLIRGDDGRLYDLRGGQIAGPPPRVGDRVTFEPQAAPGGPRAGSVKRRGPAPAPPPPTAPTRSPRASEARPARPPTGPRFG
jgi:cold shock CspA family protein